MSNPETRPAPNTEIEEPPSPRVDFSISPEFESLSPTAQDFLELAQQRFGALILFILEEGAGQAGKEDDLANRLQFLAEHLRDLTSYYEALFAAQKLDQESDFPF